MGWFEEAVVYQIYPLGCVDAPWENDGQLVHRLSQLQSDAWLEHLQKLGVTCVLLNPVFQSDAHGYDTRDYYTVDCRLGNNDDLKNLVAAYHERGIRVLFDGVFNHVGRGFWAFQDVLQHREASRYASWFCIDFGGENEFGDHLSYQNWEGATRLVKLNLQNEEVKQYLYQVVRDWRETYGVDGLRLDVAYCLDKGFLWGLRDVANSIAPDFILLGETLFGDYNLVMNEHGTHSVTNYECYKGLWSSVQSRNMHEVLYAFNRQSGPDPWCLYTGKHLLDFLDNHDVPRIATKIGNAAQLPALYTLLFGMPGVPCVYYGSEWGIEGEKLPYDHELRPAIAEPEWNELTTRIAALAHAYAEHPALAYGSYKELTVQPTHAAFLRETPDDRVIVALNIDDAPAHLNIGAVHGEVSDVFTGEIVSLANGLDLKPYESRWLTWR